MDVVQTIKTNEYATVLGNGKIFYPYIRKQTVTDHLKDTAITETVSNLEYGNPKDNSERIMGVVWLKRRLLFLIML